MATIKSNGPRKNKDCQTIMGKRQAKANLSMRLLLELVADLRNDEGRPVIYSVSKKG